MLPRWLGESHLFYVVHEEREPWACEVCVALRFSCCEVLVSQVMVRSSNGLSGLAHSRLRLCVVHCPIPSLTWKTLDVQRVATTRCSFRSVTLCTRVCQRGPMCVCPRSRSESGFSSVHNEVGRHASAGVGRLAVERDLCQVGGRPRAGNCRRS